MRPFPFKNFLGISVMNEAEVIERDRNVTARGRDSLLARNEDVARLHARGSDVTMRGSDVLSLR
jgi:hypothetical protein